MLDSDKEDRKAKREAKRLARKAAKTSTAKEDEDDTEEGNEGIGSKIASMAPGVLDIATSVITNKEDMTKEEQTSNTLNMAAKGASAGGILGPWGAGAGAVVGAGIGLAQAKGDSARIEGRMIAEEVKKNDEAKAEREDASKEIDGKSILSKKADILKKQKGILSGNYQTRIG